MHIHGNFSEYSLGIGFIVLLLCVPGVDSSFMVGLFFPFLLIISATLYAFKTRKCPGGFNETRQAINIHCCRKVLADLAVQYVTHDAIAKLYVT